HAISVTTANITARKGALQALAHNKARLDCVQKLLVDAGYQGAPFAQAATDFLVACTEVEVAKRDQLHTFAVLPTRWIAERSFAWLEKNRRLRKNCERWLNTSLQFIHLAFIGLLLRRS
ncbi:IS5/IS1182 family transposase, partial [Lampropedia puyangensis]